MKTIKFTSETTLQITSAEGYKPIKYKGYEVGSMPSLFAFIFDKDDEKDGITEWFNLGGLTYLIDRS